MSNSSTAPDSDPLDLYRIQRERRTRVVIALVVIGFIVLIPLLLFRATVFNLEISPAKANENVHISTQGGTTFSIGKRILLFGQSTQLKAESIGFHPYETTIERSNKDRLIPILMIPLPGLVEIQVQATSEVSVEVLESGVSSPPPVSAELEKGTYTISVTGDRIVPLLHELEVRGYGELQELQLVTEESTASLSVQVKPNTAFIEINGIRSGSGNYNGGISIGTHQIAFVLENYFPQREEVTVGVNENVDLGVVELRPRPGSLKVTSNPTDASVLLDGKFVGSTPTSLTIEANNAVEIKIQKPHFVTQVETVELQPGQNHARSFTLEPVKIEVEVNAIPEATVWVNGQSKGFSPSTLEVRIGDTIKVTREGYSPQSAEIGAAGPTRRNLEFQLVDEKVDKFNKAPDRLLVNQSITLRKMPPLQVAVYVPPDLMGGVATNTRRFELTRAFYLGIHEIRRKEYAKFATSVKVEASNENLPITEVSWSQAAKFCNWLSLQESLEPVYAFNSNGTITTNASALGFRLPTEAEWEAAAQYDVSRSELIGKFPWGDASEPGTGAGNFSGRESQHDLHPFLNTHVDNHSGIAPVGAYRQNANGFHDLGGNVAEWIQDFYVSKSQGMNQELKDPLGPQAGLDRIVKGAHFRTHDVKEMYINARRVVGSKDETVGFRVAKWIW